MAELNPTMLDPDDDEFDYDEDSPADEDESPDEQAKEQTEESEEETMESESSESAPVSLEAGDLLEGTVTQTGDTRAWLDLGWQADGILPYEELREGSINQGDELFVKVLELDHEDGAPLLSEKQAVAERAWKQVREAHDQGTSVEGEIFKKIKGGFLVQLFGGLTAFMPMSHLSLSRKENYDRFIDEVFDLKILEYDRDDSNVVVSRREHLQEQKNRERNEFFDEHEVGEWVEGTVKNIVNFGAFVNLGPVDGLVHISDVAWGRVRNVEDYFSVGDEIEVKILSLDAEDNKVSLGRKQKYPDPWENIEEKYEVGEVTTGEIVDARDDAVFVRLEEHIEGRVDESELAWTETWEHPENQFKDGEKMKVKVLDINPEEREIKLSHKRIKNNPWKILQNRFPEGTVLQAPVVDIHQDHITVQLLQDVKGIIREDDISWDEDVDLYENYSIGQKIKCKVLTMDPSDQLVELGIKQTTPDPWVQKARKFEPGTTLEGTVTSVLQFGAFVRLEDNLEGLVHVSEMGEGKRVNPHEVVDEGDTVGVKVLSVDEDEHKIDLSIQGYKEVQRRKEMEEYMENEESSDDSGDMTMGELLGDDLKDLMKD